MSEPLQFDSFTIDLEAFELRRDGQPVAVEPLVLDLIIEMARQPNMLRTRDDLIETVWKGRIVSDTTISTAIKSARKALGDTGVDRRLIRTVRGRGFQFIGDVNGEPTGAQSEASVAAPELPTLRVCVAVLDDTVPEALARMLETRLRAIFGRIPFLDVKAPPADAEAGAGQHPAPGATYLLEVALSSIGKAVHADASLTEADAGLQKWARHFSAISNDGVEKLLVEIGAKAEPQILREIASNLAARDQNEPRALVLQAIQAIATRGWNPVSIIAAREMLGRAIEQDDTLALAHAILSLMNAIGYRVGMLRADDSAVRQAVENAEKALALESQDSAVLGLAGCALCDVGQLARGEPIIDRAIDLDPTNGHAHAAKGAALMMRGEFGSALGPLRKSIEISPADSRLAVWGAILAMAELQCGDLETARQSAELAISRDDVNYLPRLAAVAIHLAREDAASFRSALAELMRAHPNISVSEIRHFLGVKAKEAIWPVIQAEFM